MNVMSRHPRVRALSAVRLLDYSCVRGQGPRSLERVSETIRETFAPLRTSVPERSRAHECGRATAARMSSREQGVAGIERLALRAERRIRGARALRVGARALCVALGAGVVAVAFCKLKILGDPQARGVLLVAAASVAVSVAVAWVWRLPDRAGARALDRFHGLHDRLASALAFAAHPAERRTAFMSAAIEDAVAAIPGVRPARAVAIPLPRTLAAAAVLGCVLSVVVSLEVRRRPVAARSRTIDPLEMAADDLEDVKDFLKQVEQRDESDEAKAAIAEFNKLVDDLANKRLDRTEAFRRMQALEEKLFQDAAGDRKPIEQRLEALGDELKKAQLTHPAGVALADDQIAKARDALQDLAKKLRAQATPVDKAKLDEMREALKRAAERAEKDRAALQERRDQLAAEILKKKQQLADGSAEDEQSLLHKQERELERLDRELDQQQRAGNELDRLDRELEQAAEDLMKDLGLSAQDLQQGAEDLNRMEEQRMSQQEKEELRQKLQELRQLLRQQGQGGKGQIVRLQRFGRMARGQGSSGDGEGSGQSGQPRGGQGGEGSEGQGQQPTSGSGNQGQKGAGGSSQGGETWILGSNGEKLLMLSSGGAQKSASSGGPAEGGDNHPGGWGEGHDPSLQGKATHPKMGTQDTQVEGADSAQGGSRSQVISGAAERGFASRNYQKVYTEYHQVAEESIAKDDVPGGYRFYVKRYFQLIRPRETP